MVKFKYGCGTIKKYSCWLLMSLVCLLLDVSIYQLEESPFYPDYDNTIGEKK